MTANRGKLHRHENGTEHRHFAQGFTIGGQVIPDSDGNQPHAHGTLAKPEQSGAVVWVEGSPTPCDCYKFPNMHDSAGVCVNWDRHEACPMWHYMRDGKRLTNG